MDEIIEALPAVGAIVLLGGLAVFALFCFGLTFYEWVRSGRWRQDLWR